MKFLDWSIANAKELRAWVDASIDPRRAELLKVCDDEIEALETLRTNLLEYIRIYGSKWGDEGRGATWVVSLVESIQDARHKRISKIVWGVDLD